ncbi:hypothetical protein P20652_1172 [Pseudoalteromonas sp. BSi20652]|nr:hypothetical protein P20652_1172 [Pseudoalteromonas sp. BSi20652]
MDKLITAVTSKRAFLYLSKKSYRATYYAILLLGNTVSY